MTVDPVALTITIWVADRCGPPGEAARDGGVRLAGVVHGAGVRVDRLVADTGPAEIAAVWRPKVGGAWRLDAAVRAAGAAADLERTVTVQLGLADGLADGVAGLPWKPAGADRGGAAGAGPPTGAGPRDTAARLVLWAVRQVVAAGPGALPRAADRVAVSGRE